MRKPRRQLAIRVIAFILILTFLGGEIKAEHSLFNPPRHLPPVQGKPVVLYLRADQIGELVKEDRSAVSRLEACGFDVRDTKFDNTEMLSEFLSKGNFKSDTPVILSGHGLGNGPLGDTGKHILDPKGHALSTPLVLAALQSKLTRSSIFLSSCHAGLCRGEGCKRLGTPCSGGQTAIFPFGGQDPGTSALIDLLCDSMNGCKKITEGDTNDNAVLEGTEINRLLAKAHRSLPEIDESATFSTWEDTATARARCEKKKFEYHCDLDEAGSFSHQLLTKTPRGWRSPDVTLASAGVRKLHLSKAYEAGRSIRETPAPYQFFLRKTWPSPPTPENRNAIKELISDDPTDEYIVEGDTIRFRRKREKEDSVFRIEKFELAPGGLKIKCACVSDRPVPLLKHVGGREQEVFFDSDFAIPCRDQSRKKTDKE